MIRTLFALALAVLLAGLAVVGPDRTGKRGPVRAIQPASADSERARVRAHLERVEAELRAADTRHLDAARRTARTLQLDELRAYRLAGVFPHNHVARDRRTPVFVDEHGTHCAVGHLLARSGETELVVRIAATRNTATVQQLADEPALLAWLDRNGMTAAEAAKIQPWYGPWYDGEAVHGGYATTTAVLTAAAAATSGWNLLADRKGEDWFLPAALGLASGAASVAWAIEGLNLEDVEYHATGRVRHVPSDAHVAINFAAGAVAAALGTRTLVLGRVDPPIRTDAQQALKLDVTPTAGLTGAGFRATLRF